MRDRSPEENRRIWEKHHIIVEGEDLPPPIDNFTDMKVPEPLVKFLKSKRITKPTPIQLQGIPTAYVYVSCYCGEVYTDYALVSLVAT